MKTIYDHVWLWLTRTFIVSFVTMFDNYDVVTMFDMDDYGKLWLTMFPMLDMFLMVEYGYVLWMWLLLRWPCDDVDYDWPCGYDSPWWTIMTMFYHCDIEKLRPCLTMLTMANHAWICLIMNTMSSHVWPCLIMGDHYAIITLWH